MDSYKFKADCWFFLIEIVDVHVHLFVKYTCTCKIKKRKLKEKIPVHHAFKYNGELGNIKCMNNDYL